MANGDFGGFGETEAEWAGNAKVVSYTLSASGVAVGNPASFNTALTIAAYITPAGS